MQAAFRFLYQYQDPTHAAADFCMMTTFEKKLAATNKSTEMGLCKRGGQKIQYFISGNGKGCSAVWRAKTVSSVGHLTANLTGARA